MSIYESTRKMKPAEQECFDLGYKKGLKDAVVHGRWIMDGNKILCDSCKTVFQELDEAEIFSAKADLPYLADIEKFCFNCGAKMDL